MLMAELQGLYQRGITPKLHGVPLGGAMDFPSPLPTWTQRDLKQKHQTHVKLTAVKCFSGEFFNLTEKKISSEF